MLAHFRKYTNAPLYITLKTYDAKLQKGAKLQHIFNRKSFLEKTA